MYNVVLVICFRLLQIRMWQENLLLRQKGKDLPHHNPYLAHNHLAFRERSAGRTFCICHHFILF